MPILLAFKDRLTQDAKAHLPPSGIATTMRNVRDLPHGKNPSFRISSIGRLGGVMQLLLLALTATTLRGR